MEAEAFTLEERSEGACRTLILRGELDMASAPVFEGAFQGLCEGGAQELVLDLGPLEFIDSTGLTAILRCREACEEHLCDLALLPGRPGVMRVFELTRLMERLPFRAAAEAQRARPG